MHYVRKVTNDIYWVGANDHRLALFENIHPIPKGVSYNAYLMLDEQSVLFDTIDWSACRQLLDNIEYLLEGKPLDVLVINHMEPDHGASIEEILLRYPKVKVVSTEKSFMLMRQFGFDIEGHELIEVKEGDVMSFGKHEVTFIAAPMVHWPEAMVSFDLTEGVLFSADAFGSFIALDGKLFNDEVNFDRDWIDEARRYYTNIVGKYGPHVQALLDKAAGIVDQIKFICPLHGPIWRSDFGYLLDKYQHWSSYEPEDKAVMIAYASMYGNTEAVAQALAGKLVERGITNVQLYDVSNTHVSYLISEAFRVSHLVLASVTYNLDIYPVMKSFLHDMKALNVQNRMVALIENGSWATKSGDLMEEFIDNEMKQMTILNQRLSIASSLPSSKEEELDQLADAIADSVRE
ncbi:MAG: FprA family A-type flavoprotein [Firmicutes bacterium]|nr:FprA family A-type flavoprotein [Bacillota bacterium]MBQ4504463.1 FprA family A-type flavoprotein [Bacillota bacterium]MBQ6685436.1 FprA family A-type flavoprotein [Bacillota bacterium]MBQ6949700.1 FprA family A-type flavoprotein [Bacillota bacterium]